MFPDILLSSCSSGVFCCEFGGRQQFKINTSSTPPRFLLGCVFTIKTALENQKQRLRQLLQASEWDEQDKEWLRHYLAEYDGKDLEALVFEHYQRDLGDPIPALDRAESEQLRRALHKRLNLSSSSAHQPITSNRRLFMGVAAAVLLLSLAGWWFWRQVSIPTKEEANLAQQVITPGGNKATLVLSDGRSIDLSTAKDGIVMGLTGQVAYGDGSLVSLNEQPSAKDQAVINHYTLSVPKGGQYQLTLSDGTRVWLNSASTLRYPPKFNDNFREVELEGEAYFEVSHSHNQPFVVKSAHQSTTVLGTTFNIMAYADELEMTTTLVSGAVRVDYIGEAANTVTSAVLAPGEATLLVPDGTLRKQRVDIAAATAWKDGKFYFRKTPFAQMMRQLARWYDIEVAYRGAIPNETFSGELNRDMPLETVLDFLIGSDIRFATQGRTLVFN